MQCGQQQQQRQAMHDAVVALGVYDGRDMQFVWCGGDGSAPGALLRLPCRVVEAAEAMLCCWGGCSMRWLHGVLKEAGNGVTALMGP